MKQAVRLLLIAGGTLFLALGTVGVFFPILPTTPFLLLAAACYARSSDRFYYWLLNNRWFGSYICNYRAGRGIPFAQKVLVLFVLWVTIVYAGWFVVGLLWLRLVLLGVAVGVTLHMLTTKTLRSKVAAADPLGLAARAGDKNADQVAP